MGTIATNTVGNWTKGCFAFCICASFRGISPPPKSPTPWPISFMLSEVPSCRYVTRTFWCNFSYCPVHAAYSGLGTFDPDPASEISCAASGVTPNPTHTATSRNARTLRSLGDMRYLGFEILSPYGWLRPDSPVAGRRKLHCIISWRNGASSVVSQWLTSTCQGLQRQVFMPAFRTALLKESDIAHGLDRLPGLAYLCRFQRYEVEFDLIGYERNSVRNALETELSTTRGFRLDGD